MKKYMIHFKKTAFLLFIMCLLCSPLVVSATSGSATYAGYTLSYTCTVSATKGTATTVGAHKPYSNYALIIVYNKSGKSKGSDVDYGLPGTAQSSAKATASVTNKLTLYKAMSNHAVADSSKQLIGKYTELIVKYA